MRSQLAYGVLAKFGAGEDVERSGGHPDAKTVIGWSETRAESAMREAKRRLDAVLRRRESLVNVEGSSPASVVRDDDSFSDADGGSHHQLTTPRANTRPNDDDYDADAGPFDHAKRDAVAGGYAPRRIRSRDAVD